MNKFIKGLVKFHLTIATGGVNLIVEKCVNESKNRKAMKDLDREITNLNLAIYKLNDEWVKAYNDTMRIADECECKIK